MVFLFRENFLVLFIFCLSYAEVRAEQRRELGIEESPPEISADKVRHLLNSFLNSFLYI